MGGRSQPSTSQRGLAASRASSRAQSGFSSRNTYSSRLNRATQVTAPAPTPSRGASEPTRSTSIFSNRDRSTSGLGNQAQQPQEPAPVPAQPDPTPAPPPLEPTPDPAAPDPQLPSQNLAPVPTTTTPDPPAQTTSSSVNTANTDSGDANDPGDSATNNQDATVDLTSFQQLLDRLESSKKRQQRQKSVEGRRDIYAQGLASMMSNF